MKTTVMGINHLDFSKLISSFSSDSCVWLFCILALSALYKVEHMFIFWYLLDTLPMKKLER